MIETVTSLSGVLSQWKVICPFVVTLSALIPQLSYALRIEASGPTR